MTKWFYNIKPTYEDYIHSVPWTINSLTIGYHLKSVKIAYWAQVCQRF
jgi:hypothetical protein